MLPPAAAQADNAIPILPKELTQRGSSITGNEAKVPDQNTELRTIGIDNKRMMRDEEVAQVCAQLREALDMRERYRGDVDRNIFDSPEDVEPTEETDDPFYPTTKFVGGLYSFEMHRGVMRVWHETEPAKTGYRKPGRPSDAPLAFPEPPTFGQYTNDLARLLHITSDAAVQSFCYHRLQRLEARFRLHVMEHEQEEAYEQRQVPHRDFYNVRKVDTHIHLAAAMNQKHLLRFIKRKARCHPDEVVTKAEDGSPMTLQQVFDQMGLEPYDLSIDALDMHTDTKTFCRFDKFNLKYNPLGKSKLREIFLKTENQIQGRYFAEITQELFDDMAFAKYQKVRRASRPRHTL